MNIALILIGTVVSACLYRMYGCDDSDFKEEFFWLGFVGQIVRKIPKFRSMLCNLIAITLVARFVEAPIWMYVVCYVLGYLTLLTYHDTRPWNWMNPRDNFLLHGLVNGIAFIPLAFFDHAMLLPLIYRAVAMGLGMGIWCHWLWSIDWVEEWGRGAIIILSILFLL